MRSKEVDALFNDSQKKKQTIVTKEMLVGLPAPVKRYLTHTGVVGTAIPDSVRLKQTARIRESEDKPWMYLDAEQYYTVNPPGFIWIGTVRKAGFPFIRVTDSYKSGEGILQVKLASIFPISKATGTEMDQGEMMRYLNEMTMWFPSALLGKNVLFEPIDNTRAKVSMSDRGKNVSATMYVDDKGEITNFTAPRYRAVGKNFTMEKWSTPLTEYRLYEGLNLPSKGTAVYHLKTGDLTYIELSVTELQYNVKRPY